MRQSVAALSGVVDRGMAEHFCFGFFIFLHLLFFVYFWYAM
jgi:hypothetical protein